MEPWGPALVTFKVSWCPLPCNYHPSIVTRPLVSCFHRESWQSRPSNPGPRPPRLGLPLLATRQEAFTIRAFLVIFVV